jgi:hypothetical protein
MQIAGLISTSTSFRISAFFFRTERNKEKMSKFLSTKIIETIISVCRDLLIASFFFIIHYSRDFVNKQDMLLCLVKSVKSYNIELQDVV